MKKTLLLIVVALAQALLMVGAFAQEHGTATEAKAMVEKGLALIKEVGIDKAAAEITAKDGKWLNKDIYLVIKKFDGTMIAHGVNKAMVGKNQLEAQDANGKFFSKDINELVRTKGQGWTDYMFSNPITKKIGQKSIYAVKIPGYDGWIGAGIYK